MWAGWQKIPKNGVKSRESRHLNTLVGCKGQVELDCMWEWEWKAAILGQPQHCVLLRWMAIRGAAL